MEPTAIAPMAATLPRRPETPMSTIPTRGTVILARILGTARCRILLFMDLDVLFSVCLFMMSYYLYFPSSSSIPR